MESRMIGSCNVPEYPHRPVHHLKRPTTISANGKITHCEVFFLAGQKNATKGNAGLWATALESDDAISLLEVAG